MSERRPEVESPSAKWFYILVVGGFGFGSLFAVFIFSLNLALERASYAFDVWSRAKSLPNGSPLFILVLVGSYGWGCFQAWIRWRARHPR